ncbi:MAG: monooxygenase, partial [Actinobacteria bacterium]|nr:monooxygenase [Actinomycetota bacterium]
MTKQLVVLDFWTVPSKQVPRAISFMGLHRRSLRRESHLQFWKLLGTGSGQTFTMRDSDPLQWGLLTVWNQGSDYEAFKSGRVIRDWSQIAADSAHFELEPLSAKGVWQKRTPFKPHEVTRWTGPTAALTRARIKPQWWVSFWRNIPPVSADLNQTAG